MLFSRVSCSNLLSFSLILCILQKEKSQGTRDAGSVTLLRTAEQAALQRGCCGDRQVCPTPHELRWSPRAPQPSPRPGAGATTALGRVLTLLRPVHQDGHRGALSGTCEGLGEARETPVIPSTRKAGCRLCRPLPPKKPSISPTQACVPCSAQRDCPVSAGRQVGGVAAVLARPAERSGMRSFQLSVVHVRDPQIGPMQNF